MSENERPLLHKKWKVTLIRNIQEIEGIRPTWQKIQSECTRSVVSADIDRFLSVLRADTCHTEPYVILIEADGIPIALVIGRLQRWPMKLRFGYKTLASPALRCLAVVYGGVVGHLSLQTCDLIIKELMRALRSGEADALLLNHVRTESPIYGLSMSVPSFRCRGHFPRIEDHWVMSIPETIDQFYQARSTKHRKHLRQYTRRLDRLYPHKVKMVTYRNENDLDVAIQAASQISAGTYQSALGCGFVDNYRTRTLLSTAARLGWFRGHILYIEEQPVAYRFALHYDRTYYGDGIGYDPNWSKFRVGTVLFLKVLEQLCDDDAVDYYDFGFGDAEYKQSYADINWQEASVYVFAKRLYPLFLNAVQTTLRGINATTAKLLRLTGTAGQTKRAWRNLLQRGHSETRDQARR